jgi:hypothetical protein
MDLYGINHEPSVVNPNSVFDWEYPSSAKHVKIRIESTFFMMLNCNIAKDYGWFYSSSIDWIKLHLHYKRIV